MSLYLLLSTPVFLLAVLTASPCVKTRSQIFFNQLGHALFLFLIVYSLISLTRVWISTPYQPVSFVIYMLSVQTLLPALLAITGNCYFLYRKRNSTTTCEVLTFFAIFYTLFTFFDTLSGNISHDYYTIFVRPSYQLLLIVLATGTVLNHRKLYAGMLFVTALVLTSVLQAISAWWALEHRLVLVVISALFAFVIGVGLFFALLAFSQSINVERMDANHRMSNVDTQKKD